MIKSTELTEIGSFYKPHGIKGEISAGFDYELNPDDLRCIVVEIDGIFVPFFIESWRSRGSGRLLLKLDGVNDETEASSFSNHTIYAVTDELDLEESDEEGIYLYDMIGYIVFDGDNKIGMIERVDDTTENILLLVKDSENKIVYIPFVEDWIESIDTDSKEIVMNLPDGILHLNV